MKILITGAAGEVGTGLRRELAGRFDFRLFDLKTDTLKPSIGEIVQGSISDPNVLEQAMSGVDGVIHLAGCTTDAGIEDQIEGNVRGAFNVFEAARRCGVERVVFASSHHVVGYYPRNRRIGVDTLLRPDSRYGLTKAFGEQAGALYADKYGLRVLCIRIGRAYEKPEDRRRLSIWTSWRDLAQLVAIGLEHPGLRYAVVYGVSGNDRTFFDNSSAFALGYRPKDNAETYAAEILSGSQEDHDLVGTHAIGGHFANNEFIDPIDRIHEW
ncbi:NAD(P)-dependent oxidoreductase [Agrobacterium rhizogenes]|uniref:NAD-dependent epimerase/dehydratase family protein n=1 Tax=Rhizobium rhizogenes TaxID=359 RepID=UPI0015745442|nr:NAD(P)-dependent oxidoreductase [Rhizobium rhizogenes]NTH16592.1 NAD(P)-dependent oxidoreductase [Rhizobium rhizogenes]